ncbi:MAG: hypothetical protein U0132_09210 [Gemmatimonadaceae bacterium]
MTQQPRDRMTGGWRVWLALALGLLACGPARESGQPQSAAVASATPAPDVSVPHNTLGFRSRERLEEHFRKHGREFGQLTVEEYLRLAQSLRDTTVGGNIEEITREDGVVSRFDRKSGAFVAFDADGTIRTFFRPNDGERYFQRQARRSPAQ